MILVFTENIELNCFDLQKYTKRNIIKRAKKDYLKNKLEKNINDNSDATLENSNEKTNNENSNDRPKGVIEIDGFKFDPSCDIIEQ